MEQNEEEQQVALQYSDKDQQYQELFTLFHKTIAIRERRNKRLQQQMLPLRFQEYMTEFMNREGF